MAMKNPHAMQVQRNDIPGYEVVVTEIFPTAVPELGISEQPRIISELFSYTPETQTSTRSVSVAGNDGRPHQKVSVTGIQITIVYQKGADASRWLKRFQNLNRVPPFRLKVETSTAQSPEIGREVYEIVDCEIVNHTDAAATGGDTETRRNTVVIHGIRQNVLSAFNELVRA